MRKTRKNCGHFNHIFMKSHLRIKLRERERESSLRGKKLGHPVGLIRDYEMDRLRRQRHTEDKCIHRNVCTVPCSGPRIMAQFTSRRYKHRNDILYGRFANGGSRRRDAVTAIAANNASGKSTRLHAHAHTYIYMYVSDV